MFSMKCSHTFLVVLPVSCDENFPFTSVVGVFFISFFNWMSNQNLENIFQIFSKYATVSTTTTKITTKTKH